MAPVVDSAHYVLSGQGLYEGDGEGQLLGGVQHHLGRGGVLRAHLYSVSTNYPIEKAYGRKSFDP